LPTSLAASSVHRGIGNWSPGFADTRREVFGRWGVLLQLPSTQYSIWRGSSSSPGHAPPRAWPPPVAASSASSSVPSGVGSAISTAGMRVRGDLVGSVFVHHCADHLLWAISLPEAVFVRLCHLDWLWVAKAPSFAWAPRRRACPLPRRNGKATRFQFRRDGALLFGFEFP